MVVAVELCFCHGIRGICLHCLYDAIVVVVVIVGLVTRFN